MRDIGSTVARVWLGLMVLGEIAAVVRWVRDVRDVRNRRRPVRTQRP